MKEVIEKLFQRMALSSTEEIDKMKKELLIVAEGGAQAVYSHFESIGQAHVKKAGKLADQIKAKIGVS